MSRLNLQLVFYKTYAELKAEAQRTYLGFLWWVFEPVLFMAVFYVIFGVLRNSGQENFVQFLLVGLVVWQWTSSTIGHCALTILNSRSLMKQVYLPKEFFPTVTILTDTVKFFFVFVLLLVFLWLSGLTPGMAYLALPLLLATQFLFVTAISTLHAAIVPFLPDIRFVVDALLRAVFFLSGIFFSVDNVPVEYQFYFYLNPMANLIEDYRKVLMHNQWPSWSALSIITLGSLITLWLALRFIRRFDFVYPRISA